MNKRETRKRTGVFTVLFVLASSGLHAQGLPESSFARGLEWVGVACSDTNYTLWGASPIISDDGRVHLFIARWPQTNVDPAWRRYSEIAHYVSDHPEGPFVFADVVLQGTGTNTWDKYAPHNPEIHYHEGLYVLLYIANSDFNQPPHPYNQQIGMATAPSLDGPWTKVGTDGLLLGPSSDPAHYTHGKQIVNPALLKLGDTYHLYFKTQSAPGVLIYGVATSSSVTGPYTMADAPITPDGVFIEDAAAFLMDGQVCMLTTDLSGHVTGINGAGALFKSDDGLSFDPADTEIGYYPIPRHYADYDPANVKKIFYWSPSFQRPKVLMLNGRPRYFYAPSGWNVTGGDRTVVHVMRINEEPPENPNPNLLQNGDFEAGSGIADANWGDTPTAAKLPGWAWGSSTKIAFNAGNGTLGYGNGNINLVSPAADQQVGFNSNTTSTNAALWQTFDTVPGTDYEVTFSMGAIFFEPNAMSLAASVYDGAAATGTPLAVQTATRSSASGNGYNAPSTFIFRAVSNESTLHFVETSANSLSCDPALDTISVRIAAPSSLSMENPRSLPEYRFGFDWHNGRGSGVDVYRTCDLMAPFQLISSNEWSETFIDPAPPSPAGFYRLAPAGATL